MCFVFLEIGAQRLWYFLLSAFAACAMFYNQGTKLCDIFLVSLESRFPISKMICHCCVQNSWYGNMDICFCFSTLVIGKEHSLSAMQTVTTYTLGVWY